MTKGQVHAFNWLFLVLISGLTLVHFVSAYLIGSGVGPGLFAYWIIYFVVWVVFFGLQLNYRGQPRAQKMLIVNIAFTGVWIVVYIYMNSV
ncbi:MAG TPA: hypothetical protein VFK44_06475 [Bacillales bacterium]|nr:hypothetical protein [Bacillales bacterium]